MKQNKLVPDAINLILAILLFFSPWIVGFAGVVPAAWVAWLSALGIAVVSIAALSAFAEWEEWINLVLGIWVLISPWVVHVGGQQPTTMVLFFTGLAVAIIAAIDLWMLHQTPPRVGRLTGARPRNVSTTTRECASERTIYPLAALSWG